MRLSFIGNQKAEGVSDLQLFYSYFWQWEGLTPQADYIISIASRMITGVPPFLTFVGVLLVLGILICVLSSHHYGSF